MTAPWMPPLPEPGIVHEIRSHECPACRSMLREIPPLHVGYTADQMHQAMADAARAALEQAMTVLTQYQIPVGNSAAGELACEWTYEAIKECHGAIRALAREVRGC